MRRTLLGALLVVLVAAGLSACGGDTESYCATLKADRAQLRKLSGRGDLDTTVRLLRDVGDEAPEDIAGDWDTLVAALADLRDAVRATGVDYARFRSGRKPAGVTDGEFRAVQQAAAELADTRVQQAGRSIEQHAVDVCKVDLGGGLDGG